MTEIHPEAQAVLDRLNAERVPPAYTLSPRGAREVLNDLLLDEGPPEPVGRVQDLTIDSPVGDLPIRVYEPEAGDGPYPVLLYYHGGGWVRGSVDTHDDLLRSLCRDVGCLVIGVDGRGQRRERRRRPGPHCPRRRLRWWKPHGGDDAPHP